MLESFDQMLAAVRDRTALVYLDLQPPREAPTKRYIATSFEPAYDEQHTMRPQGQGSSLAVTPEQARALIAAGAEWKGPAHLRADVFPAT